MAFYYTRPDELASYGAAVSTSVGTTDTDYTDEWICDGRSGRPARAGSGTVTWSATFSSAEVGLIAVCNCNSNVNATIAGGISTSVVAGALGANGIRLNGFVAASPATITGLTVGFSGASASVVLGEFAFGKRRTLLNVLSGYGGPRLSDMAFTIEDFSQEDDHGEFGAVPPYDRAIERRRLTGTNIYTTAQLADLQGWFRAQRSSTKPSLIVPDSLVNDAWLVQFRGLTFRPMHRSDMWLVNLDFLEYPRSRW